MNTHQVILAASRLRFAVAVFLAAATNLILLPAGPAAAQDNVAVQPVQSATQSASELIKRLLPGHAEQFVCETIPADSGKDVFEIESQDGKIVLRGNSALSLAVALNWYLKYTCHCQVSLNGSQLNLPRGLPVVALNPVRGSLPRYCLPPRTKTKTSAKININALANMNK